MKANTTQLTGTDVVFETLVSLNYGVLPDSRPHLDLTKNNVRATPALLDMLANMEKNALRFVFHPNNNRLKQWISYRRHSPPIDKIQE